MHLDASYRLYHIFPLRCDEQVHEMAMLSAIQEAQRDNLRNFDDFIMRSIEVLWRCRESRGYKLVIFSPFT